jgi:hypothetical protein
VLVVVSMVFVCHRAKACWAVGRWGV